MGGTGWMVGQLDVDGWMVAGFVGWLVGWGSWLMGG